MILLVLVGVETAGIEACSEFERTSPPRAPLAGYRRSDEAEGSHRNKRAAGGDQEVATRTLTLSTCAISAYP